MRLIEDRYLKNVVAEARDQQKCNWAGGDDSRDWRIEQRPTRRALFSRIY
jgi:hypothetical protein